MYLDRSKYVEVPIYDLQGMNQQPVFKLCIYGRTWKEPAVIHPDGNVVQKALAARGFDTDRYQAMLWDLGPRCDRPSSYAAHRS